MLKDVIQGKRKLKHPQLRWWYHPAKGGDDWFSPAKYTHKNVKKAIEGMKLLKSGKINQGNKIYEPSPVVAYGGYEYGLKEFLRKKKRK